MPHNPVLLTPRPSIAHPSPAHPLPALTYLPSLLRILPLKVKIKKVNPKQVHFVLSIYSLESEVHIFSGLSLKELSPSLPGLPQAIKCGCSPYRLWHFLGGLGCHYSLPCLSLSTISLQSSASQQRLPAPGSLCPVGAQTMGLHTVSGQEHRHSWLPLEHRSRQRPSEAAHAMGINTDAGCRRTRDLGMAFCMARGGSSVCWHHSGFRLQHRSQASAWPSAVP